LQKKYIKDETVCITKIQINLIEKLPIAFQFKCHVDNQDSVGQIATVTSGMLKSSLTLVKNMDQLRYFGIISTLFNPHQT
jgi:hypothetical protein